MPVVNRLNGYKYNIFIQTRSRTSIPLSAVRFASDNKRMVRARLEWLLDALSGCAVPRPYHGKRGTISPMHLGFSFGKVPRQIMLPYNVDRAHVVLPISMDMYFGTNPCMYSVIGGGVLQYMYVHT